MINYLQKLYYSILLHLEFKQRISQSYITNDYEPIKCDNCESYDVVNNNNHIYEDNIMVGYKRYCECCNKKLGYLSYGY